MVPSQCPVIIWEGQWVNWQRLEYLQTRMSRYFHCLDFLSAFQVRRVRDAAGRDAETARRRRGREENSQLSPPYGHPAETRSHPTSGGPGVWPRADPQGRSQRPHQKLLLAREIVPRLHPVPRESAPRLRRAGRPSGSAAGLLQREVQDLLRLTRFPMYRNPLARLILLVLCSPVTCVRVFRPASVLVAQWRCLVWWVGEVYRTECLGWFFDRLPSRRSGWAHYNAIR